MSLRVLKVLLIGLFTISMIGCELLDDGDGGTERETPMEIVTPSNSYEKELSGTYSLTSVTKDVTVKLEPPDVEGFLLIFSGSSIALNVKEAGLFGETIINITSPKWSATSTQIIVEGDYHYYELQGTDLTLILHDEALLLKFKKKR